VAITVPPAPSVARDCHLEYVTAPGPGHRGVTAVRDGRRWPDPVQRASAHINPAIYATARYDDQQACFAGLIDFLNGLP